MSIFSMDEIHPLQMQELFNEAMWLNRIHLAPGPVLLGSQQGSTPAPVKAPLSSSYPAPIALQQLSLVGDAANFVGYESFEAARAAKNLALKPIHYVERKLHIALLI